MTLTNADEEEKQMEPKPTTVINIGEVLVEVLKQALSQGRITYGVFECVDILETCPEQVMLCVLPSVDPNDLSINIHHKLIEAYCWENSINVVKIDSQEKLTLLLTTATPTSPEMKKAAGNFDRTCDLNCILIGFPSEEMSEDDFHITKYSYLYSDTNVDVIELPD